MDKAKKIIKKALKDQSREKKAKTPASPKKHTSRRYSSTSGRNSSSKGSQGSTKSAAKRIPFEKPQGDVMEKRRRSSKDDDEPEKRFQVRSP